MVAPAYLFVEFRASHCAGSSSTEAFPLTHDSGRHQSLGCTRWLGISGMITCMKKYWTVFRAGCVVLRVRLSLRLYSLPEVLQGLSPRTMTGTPNDAVMKALVGYMDRWLQLFPYNKRGNCFPRSLAIYRCARQLGYPVVFHCGVQREASQLDGHAWLTLDTHAFYEPGPYWQRFTVTFSYPSDQTGDMSRTTAV